MVGKPITRIDGRNHITSKTKFALDLDVTGAKPTVVECAPQIRGTAKSFGEAALRAMPGVIDLARIPSGVAIMAEAFGQALDAQEAIKASYNKWEAP